MGSETIKEFVVDLSWKVREDEQRRFLEMIDKAQKGVMAIAGAFGALEIAQKFEKTARSFESLYFAAARSGTAVGKLKDLEFAFTKVGGTAQEAQGLVEAFSRKLRENPVGLEAALKRFGVASTRDANGDLRDKLDLIADLDKALSNKSYQQRLHIEEQDFGLDEKAMREFRETAKFVADNAAKRAVFGLHEKSEKDAHDFENALRDIYNTLNLMWESEASKLFKIFGEDLKRFDEFLMAHHEGIKTAIEIIIGPMVALGTVLFLRVVPGLNGMIAALGTLSRFVLPGWLLSMLGVTGLAAGALGATVMPQSAGAASDLDSMGQAQERTRFEHDHPILSAPGRFWRKHAPALLGGSKNEHLRRGHPVAGGAAAAPVGGDYTGRGGNPTFSEMNAHYRAYAQAHGVSPDFITGLALSEGGQGIRADRWGHSDPSRVGSPGIAYGPFQLRKPGLGSEFEQETGLKLNSSTWRQQGEWAINYIARHGTGPWSAVHDRGGIGALTNIGRNWQNRHPRRDAPAPAPASHPWQNFVPPNFTLPPGHSAADPFGFHADMVRRAQHQGSWSNSVTNHNVNMGGQKTTINIDGAGMDPHAMADMIGRKQVRVHADFLRNAKSAIA